MLDDFIKELHRFKSKKDAEILQRFFKTGKGEYGEGDIFIGVRVPQTRSVVQEYFKKLSLKEIQKLINSKIHEERLAGFLLLVKKFEKEKDEKAREDYFNFYLKNAKKANNWDLVDLSSHKLVGNFLLNKERKVLYDFAKSTNLWEKRISIVATYSFIRQSDFQDTLKISEVLLSDSHDLIHKAVGWMLREVGKKDKKVLEKFLEKNYKKMPRTALRYSIEKFPEEERKSWLKK